MNSLLLIILLTVTITDSSGIIHDNQSDYSNGIIINQSFNDEQNNYNNGILIVKDSVVQDEETTSTPIITPTQISQSTSSSSSGGGSSGGGSITSSETFSNILKYEQREGNLITGQPVSFKFNLSVYEILLTGKENEYDVSVRVELLKDKPQKATVKPEGEVIQYFNVVTSTKRMKEAVIRFKTEYSDVQLVKWNGIKWGGIEIRLRNNFIDSKEKGIDYYEVKTETLSSFAIIRTDTTVPTLASAPQSAATPIQVNTPLLSAQEAPKQASGFDSVNIAIMAVIFALFMAGLWQLKKKS